MKLVELYKIQKALQEKINYEGTDKLKCLFVAFIVEFGECLNEWKGFKFWSTRRWEPRVRAEKKEIKPGLEDFDNHEGAYHWVPYNPLLEEFVDGFHFLLDFGLECGHQPTEVWAYFPNLESMSWDALDQADAVLEAFYRFKKYRDDFRLYEQLMQLYLGLGQLFGFTEHQIYNAYLLKNEVNHHRQEVGY